KVTTRSDSPTALVRSTMASAAARGMTTDPRPASAPEHHRGHRKVDDRSEDVHGGGHERAGRARRVEPDLLQDDGKERPDRCGHEHREEEGQSDDEARFRVPQALGP